MLQERFEKSLWFWYFVESETLLALDHYKLKQTKTAVHSEGPNKLFKAAFLSQQELMFDI